ncbi:lipid-binding SYLF domain-containing protein [Salidesulfovibrio brasiliensis]
MRLIIRFAAMCCALCVLLSLLMGCAPVKRTPNDYTGAAAALDADATSTLQRFLDKDESGHLAAFLREAHAVMVVPTYGKAAFLFSVRGGSGVLAARGADGRWNGPVFYGLGAPGFGLQAGVRTQSVIFAFRTPETLEHFMADGTIGGASFAVEFLNVGVQNNAGWDNPSPDMLVMTEISGLYAGAGFEAGGIAERDSMNAALWGEGVSADDILRGDAGRRDTDLTALLGRVDAPEKGKGETGVSP